MDVLALCWTFDSRWVFGIYFNVHLFWIPVLINLLTLIAFVIEEDLPGCCPSSSSQAILAAIILGQVSVMAISYMKTIKQKNRNYENRKKIDSFLHKYHTKKTIWSVVGLFIFTMSFILLLLEWCQVIIKPCGTGVIVARTILDMACWMYLLIIILGSILCKVCYLICAWKFPETYLRYRKVIA